MWFRKKAAGFVECVGCGCLMRVARKRVEVERTGTSSDTGFTYTIYSSPWPSTEHYCGRCAPAYDREEICGGERHYYRSEPSRNIEVDEKGKDIKREASR